MAGTDRMSHSVYRVVANSNSASLPCSFPQLLLNFLNKYNIFTITYAMQFGNSMQKVFAGYIQHAWPSFGHIDLRYLLLLFIHFEQLSCSSGKSVCLWSCRLGFDSESGQTNDIKIGVHSFSATDAQL